MPNAQTEFYTMEQNIQGQSRSTSSSNQGLLDLVIRIQDKNADDIQKEINKHVSADKCLKD